MGPDGDDDTGRDLVCVVAAANAWPFYRATGAYVCQPNRRFRDAEWLGFYSSRTIHGLVARIEHVVPAVPLTEAEAARRALSLDSLDARVGRVMTAALREGSTGLAQVVLLSSPDDPATASIGEIAHRGPAAWTMFQRYERLSRLRSASDTADLEEERVRAD